MQRKLFQTKHLSISAVCIALAVALSFITILKMPQGGSVKPLTMLFVALPGYLFGPVIGLTASFAYGILDFVLGPVFVHPVQVLLDYIIGYGILGITGFFCSRKYGLYIGYALGVAGRFICSTLSGVLFFPEYAGTDNVWAYSAGYNGSYLSVEALITLVILAIPVVMSTVNRLKRQLQ